MSKEQKDGKLTEVELEFMQILWDQGEALTEDVQRALDAQGRRLTGGTIRKVLKILMRKGHVSRRALKRGFLYRARVPGAQAQKSLVRDFVKRAFGGSAAMMVAALIDTREVGKKDLDEIKRLIAEKERKN